MKSGIYAFLFGMWILMLIGGGIVVTILGPLNIEGFGEANWIINSGLKAVIAIILVVIWILVLMKLKNWIFRKEIQS
ncbi:MAG: hypothetical protein R3327_06890 [Nitrosopumilaceae archaeon]|nr:hypothetical protein [Nitrosopumilaceae archaeon]